MLISIVIPVYNVSEYLEKCVKSVLLNEISNCEIILVDDGSTDGVSGDLCDKIASEHPESIRVIHQKNKGLGGARNTGIENAKGEYLFFLDSDDAIVENTIQIITKEIEKSHPDMISFNMLIDYGKEEKPLLEMNHVKRDNTFSLSDYPEYLLSLPNACGRVWKKSLFIDYDIRFPEKVWYEDIRTTSKLYAVAQNISTIEDALYLYFQHEGSIMRSTNVERNREIIDAFEDILNWYKKNELFEKYKDILCALCIEHLYITASVRVLRTDAKHRLLREFAQYIQDNFPGYKKQLHLLNLPKARMLVFYLLELKQYGLINLLFSIKNR